MKLLSQNTKNVARPFTLLTFILCILLMAGCCKQPDRPKVTITTIASGLDKPMGLETDNYGNVWVAQSGNGKHDGKVVVITKDGNKHDAIVNFESVFDAGSGDVVGPSHLLLTGNMLYVLGASGKMYRKNVQQYRPADAPVDASTLAVEDIGSFVLAYPFVHNAHDTHPYNLTKGPDGDLYIADAGANAIIHRKSAGVYSVLAEVPGIPNPTPVGPPVIQSVPTGIIWDGQNFLVSTLLGFPFPAGKALIYKISMGGSVSVYQQGFTCLTDLAKGNYMGRVALQYATFGGGPTGFNANTGALVWANGTSISQLIGGLNLPVGLKQVNDATWYVSSLGDGTILKVTYQ